MLPGNDGLARETVLENDCPSRMVLVSFSPILGIMTSSSFPSGIMGGNKNVPHVMHVKSDHCGGVGSFLTISAAVTVSCVLVFAFFTFFSVLRPIDSLPVGEDEAAAAAAARRANDRDDSPIQDVRSLSFGPLLCGCFRKHASV